MKSQRYEWSDKYYQKQLEGANSIDTRPSRKMLKPQKLHVTYDTQYNKKMSQSISELS